MNEVRGELKEDVLTIFLSGHIDSNNAPQVETEIFSILDNQSISSVIIDAADLVYISSAGLRVLLKVRKAFSGLKIINASTEVYDILDMTGFTEMIDVEKAYRVVSIEGCEVIGQGANGTLYRIDKDNVVKVYRNKDALSAIQHEREMAKNALVLGIPTAISYDVVKVGESYGSVFELLNASSFAQILQKEPERFEWCVKEFTGMMNRIHSTVVPKGKFPDIKDTVNLWVSFMKDYLPEASFEKLQKLVREVPHDDHMIHGDYHIKNLELQGDEVLLIDMDTLAVGHPIFELASIYNAFIGYGELDHSNIEEFLGIPFDLATRFVHDVFACYLSTTDEDKINEVMDKARVVGYMRMIRRSIRRKGLEDDKKKVEIAHWKEELIELLERIDTLLFTRNEITVDADIKKLPDVIRFLDDHLEAADCDMAMTIKLEVAVEEIFVNVAHYAYPTSDGVVDIHIEAGGDPKTITITFTDSGIPFDPLAKVDPDITLSAEERKIGGLGILMVKKTMDHMSYEYKDNKNILTMQKII